MFLCSFPPMKYLFSAIGVTLLSIGFASPVYAFNDINPNSVDATAVAFLQNQGIINGSEDGLFHPELSLTRCELTMIALKEANIPAIPSSSASFSDVPTSSWCHEYAYTARSHGILSGYPDGTFHPNQAVTEIEALKILINSLQVTLPSVTDDMYLDVHATDWWAPYIKYTKDNHLADMPTTGNYGINEPFLRSKMAIVVYHGLQSKQPRLGNTNENNSNNPNNDLSNGIITSRNPSNNPISPPVINLTSPANTVDSILNDLNQVNNQIDNLNNLDLSGLGV